MHHILRCDPCRRFTFWFTVENTDMRTWFAGRSAVFITTPCNLMTVGRCHIDELCTDQCSQEHELLGTSVSFCRSCTRNQKNLGPTITRQQIQGHTCYDIAMDAGRFRRQGDCLNRVPHRADTIRFRCRCPAWSDPRLQRNHR
jgi:hypothetical protein